MILKMHQQARVLLKQFTIPGIQTEKVGGRNQPWDQKVHAKVSAEFAAFTRPIQPFSYYEVESVWHVFVQSFPRDVNNMRIKPVLDAITETKKLWTDDCIPHVRTVSRHAIPVAAVAQEQVEVLVYGVP